MKLSLKDLVVSGLIIIVFSTIVSNLYQPFWGLIYAIFNVIALSLLSLFNRRRGLNSPPIQQNKPSEKFSNCVKCIPILFPAFRLQDNLQKGSLSSSRWKTILQRRELRRIYNEYRKGHDGQLPPLSLKQRILSKFCCCIFTNPYEWYLKSLDDSDYAASPSPKPARPKKKTSKKKKR